MKVGYARTSTVEQKAGLDAQLRDLKAAGCEEIFVEQVSSVNISKRDKLEAAITFVRKGDTLVVTKIDRLARSVRHLHEIVEKLKTKGVHFQILSLGMDTGTPIGKLILTLIGGIAEFEREIMLERQREGIAKALREGKYKGKRPTVMGDRADEVLERLAARESPSQIAKEMNMARSSVYRVKAASAELLQEMKARASTWPERKKANGRASA